MSAYKQFLTSDVIVSPLEVHKDFTFKGNELTGSDVYISRLLGRNIDFFDFDPSKDPVTGIYNVITTGSNAIYALDTTPFHNEAASIGSSSFFINTTRIVITGSTLSPNNFNTIYVPSGSNNTGTINNITGSINISSSLFSGINNISSSRLIVGPGYLFLYDKNKGYIGNFNYIVSSSIISYFNGGSNDVVTGSYKYQRLVYNSIQKLYYSNYETSEYGGRPYRAELIPGRDPIGNVLVGSASSQGHYDNYLQNTLTYPRFFPTASNARIGVLSIPNYLFGDYIQPNSLRIKFPFKSEIFEFYDDGEGNLRMINSYFGTSSAIVGNVIYPHGIVTLVGNKTIYNALNSVVDEQVIGSYYAGALYGGIVLPANVYGDFLDLNGLLNTFVSSSNFTASFSSSYTIYETQYKCTIRENEYNFTLNPSIIRNDSTGSVYGFATESYFSPYITTVGLYDEEQNLLAIGKLSQPLPSSPTTDTTILINIDR